MFEDLEIVELTHDIKKYNLKEGERGTIVEIYKEGKAYEVEFVAADGKTVTLLTLMPNDIRSTINRVECFSGVFNSPVDLFIASVNASAKYNISTDELRLKFNTSISKNGSVTEEFYHSPITL